MRGGVGQGKLALIVVFHIARKLVYDVLMLDVFEVEYVADKLVRHLDQPHAEAVDVIEVFHLPDVAGIQRKDFAGFRPGFDDRAR